MQKLSNKPVVSCIIVNYETSIMVARCIDSLKKQTIAASLEIIVVDNPSPANDIENLRKLPIHKIVQSPHNVGYGLACNAGEREASADFIAILNPDTMLPASTMEKWLESFMTLTNSHSDAGLLAPMLLNDNGTCQRSTYHFLTPINYWLYHSILAGLLKKIRKTIPITSKQSENERFRKCDWVMGAAMLIRRSVWQEINGFSKEYFMYAEDQDFCKKMIKCHYTTWYTQSVAITHTQGEPSADTRDKGIIRFYNGLATLLTVQHSPASAKAIQVQVIADMALRCLMLCIIVPLNPSNLIMKRRFTGYLAVMTQYTSLLLRKH